MTPSQAGASPGTRRFRPHRRDTDDVRCCILPVAAACLLFGCGTTDDRREIRTVVESFSSAVANDDGAHACRQLSDALVAAIESDSGQSCADAVTESDTSSGPISATSVYITSASVRQGADTIFLDREAGGWKITALGCKPKPDRSADAPLDCEEEA